VTRHFAALSIIERAVDECRDRDVRSQELIDAIKTLLPHANARWPFEQLWRGLASERGEDRAIIGNASFNAILVSLGLDPFSYRS
jgi:hypothetical protein